MVQGRDLERSRGTGTVLEKEKEKKQLASTPLSVMKWQFEFGIPQLLHTLASRDGL